MHFSSIWPIDRTLSGWGSFTPLKRYSQCILQLQPIQQYTVKWKTVLCQIVQFNINTQFKCQNNTLSKPQFSSIWLIDKTLSGATTLGQNGWYYYCLTIRLFSVLSRNLIQGVLPLCSDAVSVFYCPNWMGHLFYWVAKKKMMMIYLSGPSMRAV